MSHFITNNVYAPGFGPADSQSLPCSGVSRRLNVFSSGYTFGEHSLQIPVKFISNKRVSKAASFLCGARPGYKTNPDFTNGNNQGFARNRNPPNGNRYNSNGIPDKTDILASKNEDRDNNDEGPEETLFSSASSLKTPTYAEPGKREKEIVELLKKLQPRLREIEAKRAAANEASMTDTVKEKVNDEIMESIISILRTLSTGEGSEKVVASNNGRATFDLKATNGSQNERGIRNPMSNQKERIITKEAKAAPSKYKPIYSNEDDDNDLEEKQQQELDEESESDEELKLEQDLQPERIPALDDEFIFVGAAKGMPSEEEYYLDDADQQPAEHQDLGSLKIAELRALAKSRGVKGFSKMKKIELLELLSGSSI